MIKGTLTTLLFRQSLCFTDALGMYNMFDRRCKGASFISYP